MANPTVTTGGTPGNPDYWVRKVYDYDFPPNNAIRTSDLEMTDWQTLFQYIFDCARGTITTRQWGLEHLPHNAFPELDIIEAIPGGKDALIYLCKVKTGAALEETISVLQYATGTKGYYAKTDLPITSISQIGYKVMEDQNGTLVEVFKNLVEGATYAIYPQHPEWDAKKWNVIEFNQYPLPPDITDLFVNYSPNYTEVYRFVSTTFKVSNQPPVKGDILPKDFANLHAGFMTKGSFAAMIPLAKRGWRIDTDESYILEPPPPTVSTLTFTNKTLANATAGSPYTVSMQCTGGTPPYTWAALTPLPQNLTLDMSGVLSGVIIDGYDDQTLVDFQVRVDDSGVDPVDNGTPRTQTATGSLSLTIVSPNPEPMTVDPAPQTQGAVDVQQFDENVYLSRMIATIRHGVPPFTVIATSQLPDGLGLSVAETYENEVTNYHVYISGTPVNIEFTDTTYYTMSVSDSQVPVLHVVDLMGGVIVNPEL
jgi:hypothetical protein